MFFIPYNDDVHARDVDCKPPPEKIRGITRFLFRYIDMYVTFIISFSVNCLYFKLKNFKALYLSFVFGVKGKLLDMLTCCLLLVLLYRD